MWLWLIALVFLVVVVGSTMPTALRFLARLTISIALAIMIAVPVGVLLMAQNEDEVAMALLLAVLLFMAIFWLLKPRSSDSAPISVQPASAASQPLKLGIFQRKFSADQIAQVWDRLEDEVSHQAARIGVARRSINRSRTALKERHLDLSAHSALVILEKRIPELIDDELTAACKLPSHVELKAKDELVDLLERFAADCERQLRHERRLGTSETRILRQHIERYLDRDGLQPFN